MWPWIAVGTALLVIIIGIWILYTRFQKEAAELLARQYEIPPKYSWKDMGFPSVLVKEWEEWERFCKEKGIDPRPMSQEEKKELINKTVEGLAEHWKRLAPLENLKKDDVFKADDRFIQGTKWKSREGTYVLLETGVDGKDNADDPTRSGALFVVESSEIQEDDHLTYISFQWVNIYARRLNNDGRYNPNNESIRFSVGDIQGWDWNSKIELVGQMNPERTRITLATPKK